MDLFRDLTDELSITQLIEILDDVKRKKYILIKEGDIMNKKNISKNASSLIAPYRVDLNNYLFNKGKTLDHSGKWDAGDQLVALHYYLYDDIRVLKTRTVGGYQGTCYALLECENRIILWRDDFGSCCYCDALDGCDMEEGYEYIKQTFSEGNTLQFWSISHCKAYLEELEKSDQYNYWKKLPKDFFDDLIFEEVL